MKVKISNHAYQRWLEYCYKISKAKLSSKVVRHLIPALRQGVSISADAIHLEINQTVKAVVVPGKYGGWDVKTFYLR